jgi:non-homologous end joining protein Ku
MFVEVVSIFSASSLIEHFYVQMRYYFNPRSMSQTALRFLVDFRAFDGQFCAKD